MAALLPGREQAFMHAESQRTIARHMEKLVQNGLLPEAALAAVRQAPTMQDGLPTTFKGRHAAEHIYNHVPSLFPAQKSPMGAGLTLGTGQVSFGRARWTSDGASIFSVDDGKRLAQTPVKEPTRFERIRADRIARQQLETPLVRGVRLLPVFTPGRAFFWGSVLALWGSAGAVLSLGRSLGIKKPEDTNQVMAGVVAPYKTFLQERLQPLKDAFHTRSLAADGAQVAKPEIFLRLRSMFN